MEEKIAPTGPRLENPWRLYETRTSFDLIEPRQGKLTRTAERFQRVHPLPQNRTSNALSHGLRGSECALFRFCQTLVRN